MLPDLCLEFEDSDASPSNEVRIRVASARKPIGTVFFRCTTGKTLKPSGDALFCLGVLPAMELGCDLRIGSAVDRSLLEKAGELQKLLSSWYPGCHPIYIHAQPGSTAYPTARGTGLFFSGGVDSSYSLAEAQKRLNCLIRMVGADVPLSGRKEADRLVSNARRVAEAYGLESIIIETNVRGVFAPYLSWIDFHGAAMAAIRHLLGDHLDNVLIASSGDETSWNRVWGSHPRLDPLYATDGAAIEHHGLKERIGKFERIVSEPALMQGLRICNKQFDNCGVCDKCRMAIHCFSVLDATDKAPTFPAEDIAPGTIHLIDDTMRSGLVQLRCYAERTGRHAKLIKEIDRTLERYDRSKAIRRFFPIPAFGRRLKRVKHQLRYLRATL